MKKYSSIFILLFSVLTAWAGNGPAQIAKIDRTLWPYSIHSKSEFDFASKMEMLVFVELLDQIEMNEDSLKRYLGTEKVSVESVRKWEEQIKLVFTANFQSLSETIVHDFIPIQKPASWPKITKAAQSIKVLIPSNLQPWYVEAKKFYSRYLYEQVRLAALFPRTTSEILSLDPSEITGNDYQDKQFLLTFDDGPTVANGHTDKLLKTLEKYRLNGIFFVLGEMYQARLKSSSISQLQELYGSHVLGSHGKMHKPHPKYPEWKYSLDYTANLIDSTKKNQKTANYFRPPYGQRNVSIVEHLKSKNTKVMLWNIDSQDWNSKINAAEIANRVCTLMLLWRKGILLFHDIHPKCNEAIPSILNYFEGSEIKWVDPKDL